LSAPLLRVEGLRVAFGATEVVHGVSFDLRAGQAVALVGESGSGKTVTAQALLRLLPEARVAGQALWQEQDLLTLSEHELRRIRGQDIAFVFQEPMTALNPVLPVGQQIAEVLRLKRAIAPADAAKQAIELIASMGLDEAPRRARAYPHQLSGGQRQRVMIAMAMAGQPKLLLADEPTTALDVGVRAQILELLQGLARQQGLAVLLITHDLPLVRRFADQVLVMQNGHLVEAGDTERVFTQPQHAYTRMLLQSRPQADALAAAPKADAQVLVQAQDVSVSYAVPLPGWAGWLRSRTFVAVAGVGFTLRRGHTLGVMGESGSGKSTLALAVLGLLPCSGQLSVCGQTWAQPGGQQNRSLRQRIQVVFQDPFSSLSPRLTVLEIVGEGLRVHHAALTPAQRRDRVLQALIEVGLTCADAPEGDLLNRYPHEFSGGQRQRLAIARALVVQPEVLVLDEPTSALDVTVQAQVLQLLQRLQRQRALSYLLITHDVAVIAAMAHEVLVLQKGQVVEQGPATRVLTAPQHPYTRDLLRYGLPDA
jgi:microcin C transport system ATP-binding protein